MNGRRRECEAGHHIFYNISEYFCLSEMKNYTEREYFTENYRHDHSLHLAEEK